MQSEEARLLGFGAQLFAAEPRSKPATFAPFVNQQHVFATAGLKQSILGGIQSATLSSSARAKSRSGTQETQTQPFPSRRLSEAGKNKRKKSHNCRPARTFCTNSVYTATPP